MRMRSRLLKVLLTGTVLGCSGLYLHSEPVSGTTRPSRDWSLRQTPIVEVTKRVRDAVGNIHSERPASREGTDDLFVFAPSQHRINGMGTGIVIDPRGYIITNQHVVDEVQTIRVRLA